MVSAQLLEVVADDVVPAAAEHESPCIACDGVIQPEEVVVQARVFNEHLERFHFSCFVTWWRSAGASLQECRG